MNGLNDYIPLDRQEYNKKYGIKNCDIGDFSPEKIIKYNSSYIGKISSKINNDAKDWSDEEINKIFPIGIPLSKKCNIIAKYIREKYPERINIKTDL